MRIGIAALLFALALPAAAMGKGPIEATITGPGLAKPLKLGGPNALRPGAPMEVLASRSGFFEVAWGGSPDRILASSPTKPLGPKYRVVYLVPGPSGQEDLIRQDLYPFARGGPLTYTPPGQPFFGTRKTHGGWFRATPSLTTSLVAAGLPTPGSPSASTDEDSGPPLGLWALAAMLGLAAVAVVGTRRRARAASA